MSNHGKQVTMTKVLVEDGTNRKKFRVMLDNYEGKNLLNLRYWYTDRATGELKPTRQGLSISASNYLAFKSVVVAHDEEVTEHLNQGDADSLRTAAQQEAFATAMAEAKEVSSFELISESFRPITTPYRIEYEGGLARIIINEAHPLFEILGPFEEKAESIVLVSKLLLALDLSMLAGSNAAGPTGGVLLELIKQEFSSNLKKYSKL